MRWCEVECGHVGMGKSNKLRKTKPKKIWIPLSYEIKVEENWCKWEENESAQVCKVVTLVDITPKEILGN